MHKAISVDGHKQLDVIKDQNQFLIKMEELKLYMVKFDKDGVIKAKNYLRDCVIGDKKWWPIIIITHDKYIFFANDGLQKAWV